MLTLRKRGNFWHVRGTVRVGKTVERIAEHSTGTGERHLAEAYKAKLQREAEVAVLHGRAFVQCHATLAEALVVYRAGHDHRADVQRACTLYEHFGPRAMGDITDEAFALFCEQRLAGRSKNTWRRYRTTLLGLFRAAGAPPPKIKTYGQPRTIVAFLARARADALCAAYDPHVAPAAMFARFTGLRAGEQIGLKRADVDLAAKQILVRDPKNGRDRLVPLVPRALRAIAPLARARKDGEHLFLTRDGAPYDPDGNPFLHAHWTACERAGVENFRWHDWRHHWATWAARPSSEGGAGMDLVTLMKIGGWSSLTQVQRYAAASTDAAYKMLARMR